MQQILVVDDSATMRKMVMAALRQIPNLTFGEASNGLEAIEQLAIAPFDLMVLDLNMPDMHGLEVLNFVLNHFGHHQPPVVILTTKGDEQSKRDAIAAGAASYITKPFEPRQFAQQIQHLLASA
jgi:two-component system chemotaxis response regulator CheY